MGEVYMKDKKDRVLTLYSIHRIYSTQQIGQHTKSRERARQPKSWPLNRLNPKRKEYNKLPDHGTTLVLAVLYKYTSTRTHTGDLSRLDPSHIIKITNTVRIHLFPTTVNSQNYCTTSPAVAIAELPLTQPASLHSPQFP